MTSQVFRAHTLAEARRAAIETIGSDAVVLVTRKVRRTGVSGWLGASEFEVLASAPEPERTTPTPPRVSTLSERKLFSAEVYQDSRTNPREQEISSLRAELRGEIRAMKAALTRPTPAPELLAEVVALRNAVENLVPEPKKGDKIAALLRARGIEGAAFAAFLRTMRKFTQDSESETESGRAHDTEEDAFRDAVAEIVRVAPGPLTASEPSVVLLVGPTGVGKTTTAAKIAAQAIMEGRTVTLVAGDMFRVGAIEQLERYATLMGAEFRSAPDTKELRRVVETAATDLVIIDTSGRTPTAGGAETFFGRRSATSDANGNPVLGGRRIHVLLCLPASMRAADAVRAVRIFAPTSPTSLVLTKLDETDAPAGLVHALFAAKIPISVLCFGQRVPEDISPATMGAVLDHLSPGYHADGRRMSMQMVESEKRAERVLKREDYERFLPLVRRTAMRFARKVPSHITVADLVGYGWVGLIEAYSRAEETMAAEEFEAYALYRVRGAMLDFLRSLDPATRSTRSLSRKVARVIKDLSQEFGRAPDEKEIAARLGVSEEAYREVLTRINSAGMARLELLDIDQVDVESKDTLPEQEASRREICDAVTSAIQVLPPKLQQVLALYYQEECTLREIGTILGVSESRVSQLHTEAMHRLRASVGKE